MFRVFGPCFSWPRRFHIPGTIAALAIVLGIAARAPGQPAPAGEPVTIPNAERFDVRARSGLEYRIFLAEPEGPPPPAGFPIIYLTDGNDNFSILLAAARKQSRGGSPAVVVGIGYPTDDPRALRDRRAFDLAPPTSEAWRKSSAGGMADLRTGGDHQFLEFIESELKPIIEARCKVDRSRQALFGHSFGGLFALGVLFNRPEAFQTYLVVSPSLWWNDGSPMVQAKEFVERHRASTLTARVLVMVGERERRPPPGGSRDPAKRAEQPRSTEAATEFVALLNGAAVPGLTAELREFPEEDHGSVILPAASLGARFALDDGRGDDPPTKANR